MILMSAYTKNSCILYIGRAVKSSFDSAFPICFIRKLSHDRRDWKTSSENYLVHQELEKLPAYQNFIIPDPKSCMLVKNFVKPNPENCRNKTICHIFEDTSDDASTTKQFNSRESQKYLRTYFYGLSTLRHPKYDKLVSNLWHNMIYLPDSLLLQCLVLTCFRSSNRQDDQTFKYLWTNLDQECVKRYNAWPIERQLLAADIWFHLYPDTPPKYIRHFLTSVAKMLRTLTPPQLIHTLFLINVHRKVDPVFIRNIERTLEPMLKTLTINELAVIALAFFKTETRISSDAINIQMVESLVAAMPDVSPVVCNSIIKSLHYTDHLDHVPLKRKLLQECARHKIWNDNSQLAAHVCILANQSRLYIPHLLDKITIDIQRSKDHRLKDIDKILFVLAAFAHSISIDFLEFILKLLRSSKLQNEGHYYPYSYISCFLHLAYMGIYPHKELDKVLSPQFWELLHAQQKNQDFRRVVAMLDCLVELDEPYYTGNRLNSMKRFEILQKCQLHYENGSTGTYGETLNLQVNKALKLVLNLNVPMLHILPYMSESVFLVVINQDGSFEIPPEDFIADVRSGFIVQPTDSRDWLIIWPQNKNYLCSDLTTETGLTRLKERHFLSLGFKVLKIPVPACVNFECIRMFLKERLCEGGLHFDSLF